MYRVTLERHAKKELDRLPKDAGDRVAVAIASLTDDPRPSGCLKLSRYGNLYRIRVGEYRVIYEIRDEELVILVVRVARRGERTYDL